MEKRILDVFYETAINIGRDWRKLGVYLRYRWRQLDQFMINKSNSNTCEYALAMLIDWRKGRNMEDGNVERELREVLDRCKTSCDHTGWQILTNPRENTDLNDDVILYQIAENIASEWKNLGHHLKFYRHELENIEKDWEGRGNMCADAAMEMLVKWRSKKPLGEQSQRATLVQAIRETGLDTGENHQR